MVLEVKIVVPLGGRGTRRIGGGAVVFCILNLAS